MSDLLTDISQLIDNLGELLQEAVDMELPEKLARLDRAAHQVGESWSKSWIGYHAFVYCRNFKAPSGFEYFDPNWGLRDRGSYLNLTKGSWEEYEPETVAQEILYRADYPGMENLSAFNQKAKSRFKLEQQNLLSIIDIKLGQENSRFLTRLRDELEGVSTVTAEEIRNSWVPEENKTEDLGAIQQGLRTPVHLDILARVESIQNTVSAVQAMYRIARQARRHISRQEPNPQQVTPTRTRVFIGHGRSPLWRELKDFLEEELGLPVTEFNRVSPAGITTPDRLWEMLNESVFAFLVMTGEDEQPTGELRPRENVVHEAGMFQARLGFKRAIVLLEEGCEKFSNNAGLTHIPFPKGYIRAAFQDIREVLEREGLVNKVTAA